MNIFVLSICEYDSEHTVGVFSSLELAKNAHPAPKDKQGNWELYDNIIIGHSDDPISLWLIKEWRNAGRIEEFELNVPAKCEDLT